MQNSINALIAKVILRNSIGNNKNCIIIDVISTDNNLDNPNDYYSSIYGEGGWDDDGNKQKAEDESAAAILIVITRTSNELDLIVLL
jgi:hypothetical protein